MTQNGVSISPRFITPRHLCFDCTSLDDTNGIERAICPHVNLETNYDWPVKQGMTEAGGMFREGTCQFFMSFDECF